MHNNKIKKSPTSSYDNDNDLTYELFCRMLRPIGSITEKAYYNSKSRKFVYINKYGKESILTVHEDDVMDKYIGVALAMCYQNYGGRQQFKKFVDKIFRENKKEIKNDK